MTKHTSPIHEAATAVSAPVTPSHELLEIAFARLGELQTQLDRLGEVNDILAAALDQQAEIISRFSQRLHSLEGDDAPSFTMPTPRIISDSKTLISHNPNPKPRKRKRNPVKIGHGKQVKATKQVIAASNGRLTTTGAATSNSKGQK